MSADVCQRSARRLYTAPVSSIVRRRASPNAEANSSGATNFSHRWVPRGRTRNTYSAPVTVSAPRVACELAADHLLDEGQSNRVELMEHGHFAAGIPPFVGHRRKAGDLVRIERGRGPERLLDH